MPHPPPPLKKKKEKKSTCLPCFWNTHFFFRPYPCLQVLKRDPNLHVDLFGRGEININFCKITCLKLGYSQVYIYSLIHEHIRLWLSVGCLDCQDLSYLLTVFSIRGIFFKRYQQVMGIFMIILNSHGRVGTMGHLTNSFTQKWESFHELFQTVSKRQSLGWSIHVY